MIQQITTITPRETTLLERSRRGMQILSYYKAYGADYDFCRFFRLDYPASTGFLLLLNATLLAFAQNPLPTDELRDFILLHRPFRVECDAALLPGLRDLSPYRLLRRTCFAMTPGTPFPSFDMRDLNPAPRLDDVYSILKEGFPNMLDYPLWLTDASHRRRHGMSRFFIYKNISTLSWIFDCKGSVLVGGVATRPAYRGCGYAGDLLRWSANELIAKGKTPFLYALDIRRSFYEQLGFPELAVEYVLERRDIPKEEQEKRAL